MPTYEYKCTECENVQEQIHSMLVTPEVECEVCGKRCEKVFTANGNFILKGNDWPSRDYKTKEQMTKKNTKMKNKMIERENSGQGVTKMQDLKKSQN